ncbi:MAG: hypothetical protein M1482_01620 [Chloroflexi bacterium]|nr:hypothetical protein [Chloroflexota bacterium]
MLQDLALTSPTADHPAMNEAERPRCPQCGLRLTAQGFFPLLDFSHAAGYVAQVGLAVLGEGTPEVHAWLTTTLHELKHHSPDQVLRTLREIQHELEGGAALPETLDSARGGAVLGEAPFADGLGALPSGGLSHWSW